MALASRAYAITTSAVKAAVAILLSSYAIEWAYEIVYKRAYSGVCEQVGKRLKTLRLAHARSKGCNNTLFWRWGSCQRQDLNTPCPRPEQTARQL